MLLAREHVGFMSGHFFLNVLSKGEPFRLMSAGIMPIYNIAIVLEVGNGFFAIFEALDTAISN